MDHINITLSSCAFIYDRAGGLLSATVFTWENEEDGVQFKRQKFSTQEDAIDMYRTLPTKTDNLGWVTTKSGRVRAFVLKSTNVRLGTFYAFLEELEQRFFSDNPEGIEIRFNTKGPRS